MCVVCKCTSLLLYIQQDLETKLMKPHKKKSKRKGASIPLEQAWTDEHEEAFRQVKLALQTATANYTSQVHTDTHVQSQLALYGASIHSILCDGCGCGGGGDDGAGDNSAVEKCS